MKKIVKYKIFKNSYEFEGFQKDNNVVVIAVTPIPEQVSTECVDGDDLKFDVNIAVFVTYMEPPAE